VHPQIISVAYVAVVLLDEPCQVYVEVLGGYLIHRDQDDQMVQMVYHSYDLFEAFAIVQIYLHQQ
jgi:hypothetical protein